MYMYNVLFIWFSGVHTETEKINDVMETTSTKSVAPTGSQIFGGKTKTQVCTRKRLT